MKKVIAYFVAVATLLCLAGCQQAPVASSAPELIKPVGAQQNSDTFTVERGEIASISMLPGAVVPYVEELSFGVKGVLGKLNVVHGDKVKKGQVVATLNVNKSLNKIAQLESDLTHSLKMAEFEDRENQLGIEIQKVELENLKQSGASAAEIKVAEVELEIAEAKLRQEKILRDMEIQKQQANLDELKKTIEGYELIAPCDGRVVAISAQEGKSVAADKVVVCIADETRRFVSPSYEADFLRLGNPEQISFRDNRNCL